VAVYERPYIFATILQARILILTSIAFLHLNTFSSVLLEIISFTLFTLNYSASSCGSICYCSGTWLQTQWL